MHGAYAMKDTLASTNYRTRCRTHNDFALSGVLRKQRPLSELEQMQHLNIEVETLMEKLEQKVGIDERKTAQNSEQLD